MIHKAQIIIQARLSSTRMPGKVLQPFVGDQSILDLQLSAIKSLNIPVILATTTSANDDALAQFAQQNDVDWFRGSETDVLGRFLNAPQADYIVRVCSDNPFLDTHSIQKFINEIAEGVDYISFKNSVGTPAIKAHWGLFAEVVSRKALVKAYEATENHPEGAFYREHVTNYIYGHPDLFQVKLLPAPEIIKDRNDLRFTIDTPEDFANMQKLYPLIEKNGGDFSIENLVRTTDNHAEIKKVMAKGIARFSK